MKCRTQSLAKRNDEAFLDAAVAMHRHVYRSGFIRLQIKGIGREAAGELLRHRVEQYPGAPAVTGQPLIVYCHLRLAHLFARRAPMSAWLSNTAKQSPCLSVRRGRVEDPVPGM